MQSLLLSHWAKAHPRTARRLIILLHIIAMCLAFEIGVALYTWQGRPWSEGWMLLLLVLLHGLGLLFPRQADGMSPERRYWRSRWVLLGLVCTTWGLVAVSANLGAHWAGQPDLPAQSSRSSRYTVVCGQAPLLMTEARQSEQIKAGFKWLLAKKKTFIRAKIYRAMGKQPKNEAEQIGLTLLILVVFSLLSFLVAALACNLSCAGQESAALVVIILGGGGLIFGLIAALKAIWHSDSKGADLPPQPGAEIEKKRPPSKKI